MEYTRLGSAGLVVSRLVLGCWGFGEPGRGTNPWSVPEEQARPVIRAALEAGVTTFDTANVYSLGSSEEILGRALAEMARRDEVVVATKIWGRMGPGPNGGGLSRGAVLTQVEACLRRLGTDHVDLLQIHRLDDGVPMLETMAALDEVVRAGKARYLGASSMWTWQFAQLQHLAELHGLTRFVSMQDQYSLLMREEEREMHPFCAATGVGVLAWSPLARGRLTRDWDQTTARGRTDEFATAAFSQTETTDRRIVETVREIAEQRSTSRAQVALAWALARPAVTAPVIGATTTAHLRDNLAALDLELTDDELDRLGEHYIPHHPTGLDQPIQHGGPRVGR